MKRPNPQAATRLAAALAVLYALTSTYAQGNTPASTVSTTKVDVGDHHLYLSCAGEGHPTVMMEAGYGDTSDVWAVVQLRIATFTRVCVYDRAGLGRSEPVGERSVQDVLNDLTALPSGAAADGPVVLVGHSIGGLIVNMLAHQQPERVAGLVLIDSSHPDQLLRLRQRLPKAWLEARDTFFADAPAFETWDSDLATAQGRTPYTRVGSLGDLPLTVLTRDVTRIDPEGVAWIQENIWPGYSTAVDRLYGTAWLELQHEYRALSSRGIQLIVTGSTHYIHRDRPEVVVEAVRRVVAQARTREPVRLAQTAQRPQR